MVFTSLLLLSTPSSIGRLHFTSPWDMVVMVAAMVEVVGEEGEEGMAFRSLLLLPACSTPHILSF